MDMLVNPAFLLSERFLITSLLEPWVFFLLLQGDDMLRPALIS